MAPFLDSHPRMLIFDWALYSRLAWLMADISEIFSNTPVTANAAPCAVKTDFFKGWVHVDFVDSFMSVA